MAVALESPLSAWQRLLPSAWVRVGSLRRAIDSPARIFTVVLPLLLRVLRVVTGFFHFGPCFASSDSSMAWRNWQVEPLFDASRLLLRFTGSNQSCSGSSLAPFPPCCGLSLETRLWLCPSSWGTAHLRVSPCSRSSPSEVLRNPPPLYLVRFSPARSGHAHPRIGEWRKCSVSISHSLVSSWSPFSCVFCVVTSWLAC